MKMQNDRRESKITTFWNERAERFSRIYKNTKPGFERWIDFVFRRFYKKMMDYLFRYLGKIKDMRVLDIGCGPGAYLLASLNGGACEVVGIDLSSRMLSIAFKNLTRHYPDRSRWRLLEGAIESIEFSKGFDVVFAIGVLEYIVPYKDIISYLHEITRGVLIMTFPHIWALRVPFRLLLSRHKGVNLRFFKRKRVEKICVESGYRILKLRRFGPVYLIVLKPVSS